MSMKGQKPGIGGIGTGSGYEIGNRIPRRIDTPSFFDIQ